VKEAHALVQALNLDQFFVYGSSWGSMLAQEFAISNPRGLIGMILDGALCDGKLYIESQWQDVLCDLPTFT
jgi:pimeloyl-ACP methyl ester carboxylesterase